MADEYGQVAVDREGLEVTEDRIELRHQRPLLAQVCWSVLTPGVRTELELRREPGFVHLAVCEDRP